jgi:putative tryptophan/tyrosine transport system substrate-binding protein
MKRREFITLLGSAAVAWPLAARAQQRAFPVIGYLNSQSLETEERRRAFQQGLKESGYVEGENLAMEYRFAGYQMERLPELVAELVRQRVAVIVATSGPIAAVVAKAATRTIPIVFGVGDDPVKEGLVASLARPDGNATGVNFFLTEVVGKRLGLLHEIVPKAVRVAVLNNPANTANEPMLRDISEAARALGMQAQVFNASTGPEIEAAFAGIARERADALFAVPDGFFNGRRVQLAILAVRYGIPAAYSNRDIVEAGGLMSYGTDIADMFRQVGVYAGRIFKGAKPADLPVIQSTKFELAINLQTARALGLTVPPTLLAITDEVIE